MLKTRPRTDADHEELIRTRGDYRRQLNWLTIFGLRPRAKPGLSEAAQEVPPPRNAEEWNQISFDDHVHDANTKGRKSSTHLIMDA